MISKKKKCEFCKTLTYDYCGYNGFTFCYDCYRKATEKDVEKEVLRCKEREKALREEAQKKST